MARRNDIDCLKAIAIISVVFYHMGLLESGYLGVDVFLVVAGFLTVPRLFDKILNNEFGLFSFWINKVIRLLPAVLLASLICLGIGYFCWLPDDYENLAQSVIATTFFSNNILSRITTKNYWNTINDYKPLMHTWYLGIIMQFYVFIPIYTICLKKVADFFKVNKEKIIVGGYYIITIVSLLLFVDTKFSVADKFYLLPFRLYEIMFGGLIGLNIEHFKKCKFLLSKGVLLAFRIALLLLLGIGLFTWDVNSIGVETNIIGGNAQVSSLILPNVVLVILVVIVTSILLILGKDKDVVNKYSISFLGKRSYSVFVWHQVLIALYRYSVSSKISISFCVVYIIAVLIVSELSYRFIELKIKINKKTIAGIVLLAMIVCMWSGVLYLRAGVVRDIPELNINVNDVHRNMHAEYCDRIYDYDVDFLEDNNGRLRVLIIGNSYARDFANVLLESVYADEIEISYSFSYNQSLISRIENADKIFVFGHKDDVPQYLWDSVSKEDVVYGIGTKIFGTLNGQIYFRRISENYFSQTVKLDDGYKKANELLSDEWGNNYIDMILPVMNEDGIRVFTDDNKFISQDTKHLTKAGAVFYSQILNLEEILY